MSDVRGVWVSPFWVPLVSSLDLGLWGFFGFGEGLHYFRVSLGL